MIKFNKFPYQCPKCKMPIRVNFKMRNEFRGSWATNWNFICKLCGFSREGEFSEAHIKKELKFNNIALLTLILISVLIYIFLKVIFSGIVFIALALMSIALKIKKGLYRKNLDEYFSRE